MAFGLSPGIAAANAPLPELLDGVAAYVAAGVPETKLVPALSWYGYNFGPCANQTVGSPCSYAPGQYGAIGYADALELAQSNASLTPVVYDRRTASSWFDCLVGGKRHQVHFDTPASLAVKYSALRARGVRGVAIWSTAAVEEGGPPPDR